LAALAAGERMALLMHDAESQQHCQAVREAGMKNQNEKLWNGEYYIQIPEPKPARDYNTGCHADQLLGQWWAHMLDLGYQYLAFCKLRQCIFGYYLYLFYFFYLADAFNLHGFFLTLPRLELKPSSLSI
jgi:hypothetical protein